MLRNDLVFKELTILRLQEFHERKSVVAKKERY